MSTQPHEGQAPIGSQLPSAEGVPAPEEVTADIVAGRRLARAKDGLATVGLVGAIGAAGLFVSGVFLTPCVGATRSATLEWERKQNEVASQIAQIAALRTAANESSTEENNSGAADE